MQMIYRTLTTDTTFSKNVFLSAIIEWNKLDFKLRIANRLADFKKSILSFIRPKGNRVFNCNSSAGLKFVTRVRHGLSRFREHKFKHSFEDSINSLCSCTIFVVWMLNQLFTISFTALYSQLKDTLF